MKKLILLALSVAFISADLSGLYSKITEPTIENIKSELANFKASIKDLDLTADQQAALDKLEATTEETIIEATLYRKMSNGPKFKK